jgi:hypothetical protein
MHKRGLAISGAAILSIGVGLFIIPRVPLYISLISEWINREYVLAEVGRPPDWVLGPLGGCSSAVSISTSYTSQIMTESESQAVVAEIVNNSRVTCEFTAELYALTFVVMPDKAKQVVVLPPNQRTTVRWFIAPSKVGNFHMFVSADSRPLVYQYPGNNKQEYASVGIEGSNEPMHIRVTNIFGFTAFEANLLSLVGSLLGPALTLPFWYEKCQRRKKRPQSRNKHSRRWRAS